MGKKVAAVDGAWSAWDAWGTCGNGKDGKTQCTKQRNRYCNNPAKSGGGKDCEGSATEKTSCKASDMTDATKHPNCVITAGWSAYGKGSKCNAACKTTQTRTCTNPAPINSKTCEGAKTKTSVCTGGDCQSSKETGTIKSPNYPNSYSANTDKTYNLVVADGSKVELTFTDFQVEAEATCSYDSVEVFDTNGKSLKKLCGSTKPDKITSSGKSLKVVFKSDWYMNMKGFSATWKKV